METDIAIDDKVIINGYFDEVLQEIDLLFNTEKCELLGDTSYGSNFEYFLWHLNPSLDRVKSYIYDLLNTITFISEFDPHVDVQILDGEYREIYYIVISLTYGKSTKYRKYEFR